MEKKQLISTSEYPCKWDELIDADTEETVVMISSMSVVPEEEKATLGISKGGDGIWDIVIKDDNITKDRLDRLMSELSKKTGVEYDVKWDAQYLNYTRL